VNSEEAIAKQVEMLRKGYGINKYPKEVEKLCNECDEENFKFTIKNDLGYQQINLSHLGIPEPFHRASIVGFPNDGNPIWYIVDPVYGQFFDNDIFKEYMFNNHKAFTLELLDKGYVRCTLENIFCYMDGFMNSNAYTNDIDKDKVYENVDKLLSQYNIVNKKRKIIELLNLKKELLETKDIEKGFRR